MSSINFEYIIFLLLERLQSYDNQTLNPTMNARAKRSAYYGVYESGLRVSISLI